MSDTSSHLTVAATLLLRCTLQEDDPAVVEKCITDVRRLQELLEKAKAEYGWDLGDTCVAHCKSYTERILAGGRTKPTSLTPNPDGISTSQPGLNDSTGTLMSAFNMMDVEQWTNFDLDMTFYDAIGADFSNEETWSLMPDTRT
jgi:hypothetical protein